MAEHKFGEFSDAQESSLYHLEIGAREDLNEEYGTGYPRYAGGNGLWFYHNYNHGDFVGNGTERGSEAAGMLPSIRRLGRYAGVRHDAFQGLDHEARGAALVEEELRREAMPEWAAVMASLAINGTGVVINKDGVIVAQKASQQEYPHIEAEKMALAMADADMGVLYSPWGPLYMHDYYRETVGLAEPVIGGHFLGFKEGQLRMLDKYRYPSPHGEKIFATHRAQVMAYHEEIQGWVQTGDRTWTQLRARDQTFAQSLV